MNKKIKGLIILAIFGGLVWLAILAGHMKNRQQSNVKTIDSLHYDGYNLTIYIRDTVFTYHLNVQPVTPIRQLRSIDSSSITSDSTFIVIWNNPHYLDSIFPDKNHIEIKNHKGDIITGKAVKNVYNNQ